MKKFVIILLVLTFIFMFASPFNRKGEFVGLKTTLKNGLDFFMYIPSKAQTLLSYFLPISPFEPPGTDAVDFVIGYRIFGQSDDFYLSLNIVSFSPGDSFSHWFWNMQTSKRYDTWVFEVVSDSSGRLSAGMHITFCTGRWSAWANYHTLIDWSAVQYLIPGSLDSFSFDVTQPFPYHLLDEYGIVYGGSVK